MSYPETRRVDQVDKLFGEKVEDPYRWLENDVRTDPEVAAWVAAQNRVTDAYLATLPGRAIFKERLRTLIDYERFGLPTKKGSRYFYTRNSGVQNQSVLYVRDTLDGPGRVLIDPNGWAADGATALSEWVPSENGRLIAYGIQDGGTDWRTLKVLDVATGKPLDDEVKWAKFTAVAWAHNGSGHRPTWSGVSVTRPLNERRKYSCVIALAVVSCSVPRPIVWPCSATCRPR